MPAEPDKPGVAPLRAHVRYEPVDYQPGVPPRVVTTPDEEDLAGLLADLRAAKEAADHVVLSLHWGVHFVPRVIADYQKIVANAAFAAGADLILGHHAHVPKAIEVRDGKTCFYSLSNFITSSPAKNAESAAEFCRNYGISLDPDYPHLPYGTDAKRSLIAKAVFSAGAPTRTAFLPVIIDRQLRPEILKAGDPRFTDMLRYMEWASESFAHRFAIDGDEIAISG
jgi:poly-gamma-glutamate synthesis protein (capsule biosynthesis protein)